MKSSIIMGMTLAVVGGAHAQQPTVIAEVTDGTCYDIAASATRGWLAQGRTLAVIDPQQGARLTAQDITYPDQLTSVEYNESEDLLYVATTRQVFVYDLSAGTSKTWTASLGVELKDVKFIEGTGRVIVLSRSSVHVLDHSGASIIDEGAASHGGALINGERLQVHQLASGTIVGYMIGPLPTLTRDINGFVTFELNVGGTWAPARKSVYDPRVLNDDTASVQYLQVMTRGSVDTAWVACRHEVNAMGEKNPLVVQLDVSSPQSTPFQIASYLLDGATGLAGAEAWNVQLSRGGPIGDDVLWIAVSDRILRYDIHYIGPYDDLVFMAQKTVGFFDAGERDMALVKLSSGDTDLWTATHHNVDHCLWRLRVDNGTAGFVPQGIWSRWWISSSDGAVAVPEWDSVYLPTFGGVARYDISNLSQPTTGGNAYYQPGSSNTEHIAFLKKDGLEEGFLGVVRGKGGIDVFPVSMANPNPGGVMTHDSQNLDVFYANGIEAYESGTERYFLSEFTTKQAAGKEYWLQAWRWNELIGEFELASEMAVPHSGPGQTHFVSVVGDFAIFGGGDMFCVVDLGSLALGVMSLADTVAAEGTLWTGFQGAAGRGGFLFLGTDGGDSAGVASYAFDLSSGDVGGASDDHLDYFKGAQSRRVRMHPTLPRLYNCGNSVLEEYDVSNPGNIRYLSRHTSNYQGQTQDCRFFTVGSTPYILYVENNEAFSILDPDDGL